MTDMESPRRANGEGSGVNLAGDVQSNTSAAAATPAATNCSWSALDNATCSIEQASSIVHMLLDYLDQHDAGVAPIGTCYGVIALLELADASVEKARSEIREGR